MAEPAVMPIIAYLDKLCFLLTRGIKCAGAYAGADAGAYAGADAGAYVDADAGAYVGADAGAYVGADAGAYVGFTFTVIGRETTPFLLVAITFAMPTPLARIIPFVSTDATSNAELCHSNSWSGAFDGNATAEAAEVEPNSDKKTEGEEVMLIETT